MLCFIQNVFYNDTSLSDHGFVSLKMDLDNVEKGPGVWILNNNFLFEDEYVSKIKDLISKKTEDELYFAFDLVAQFKI